MTQDQSTRLLKNYANARLSWEAWCYLNNIGLKNNNYEIREYCNVNPLMFHCRYLLLKDVHIELYKILKDSKNTVDNVFKYLRINQNEECSQVLKELHLIQYKIKLITDTRDKFYAHLDIEYEDHLSNFKVEYYYDLLQIIEKSIIALGLKSNLLEILNQIPSKNEFDLRIYKSLE